MLTGKTIILGVTGSIAAYKAAYLASLLRKQHASVQVIMTRNAMNFIHPITFEQLTGRKCLTDTFDRSFEFKVEHISLAKEADLAIIAPATANVLSKLACGIADDMLTTTLLACTCPKLAAPAMNTRMLDNPATQRSLAVLRGDGWEIIEPAEGHLACGDDGRGKLPDEKLLLEHILRACAFPRDMEGKRVLVTAGPTQESIDPVRYITNHSTGKMGYAIARMAALRGARVTLVSGPSALSAPAFADFVPVVTAADMFREVTERAPEQDIIIKAAAVADYTPVSVSDEKIRKGEGEMSIPLTRTKDILRFLGENRRPGQLLCGFAMETSQMEERAKEKLEKKHLDLIAANSLKVEGAGFGTDTNVLTLISKEGTLRLEKMSKEEAAMRLLDRLLEIGAAKEE